MNSRGAAPRPGAETLGELRPRPASKAFVTFNLSTAHGTGAATSLSVRPREIVLENGSSLQRLVVLWHGSDVTDVEPNCRDPDESRRAELYNFGTLAFTKGGNIGFSRSTSR